LRVDGRAPFNLLACVLGCSEQTVARRYRRLREAGFIRVLVLRAPAGPGLDWFVRIQVRPGAATNLAEALSRRPDVSWVTLTSGGAEVLCVSRPSTQRRRDALLLTRLPRTNAVAGLVAHAILHPFAGSGTEEWTAFDDPLNAEQDRALRAGLRLPAARPITADRGAALTPDDQPLLSALDADGRASYATLAAHAGWSAARVARRMEQLLAAGALLVDTDVATDLLGFSTHAVLWMSVEPSRLDSVGRHVAGLTETAYAAAVSGPANLLASIVCRNSDEVYHCLTHNIGALEGVRSVEVSPVIRRLKQAGTRMEGPRLAPTL
jgi:DNA-binding Lrp family transcriptional regulator